MKAQTTTPTPRWRPLVRLAFQALALMAVTATTKADNGNHHAPELPAPVCQDLNVPEGHRVSARLYALGVQIYRWNGTNWVFIAPEATLYADPGYRAEVGIHYAGPTWEASDGSKVVGARLASCTPYRGAIPWLLLSATPAPGHGHFAGLTYIQRVNTIGGTAPAEPGDFVGDEARVPYTTEYYFYRASTQ
jgi:hypothetical protein